MGSSFRLKFFISFFLLAFPLYLASVEPAQALEEGDCFNTSTVVITGSITDVSGISEINVTVDSSPPSNFDIDNGNWTATFTGLGEGPHTLLVTGTDACGSGNTATTDPLGFEVDTAVAVTITEPVDGATVGTGNVRVAGTADTDITTISLFSTQGTWTDDNPVVSGGAWSSTLQGLVAGPVAITVTGTDDCGNIGSDSVTVRVPPCILYVDDTATGAGTGLSWADAFTVVQDAVDIAISGCMIWVAEGTYPSPPTSPAFVLTMKAGVDVYGGFTGTESELSERGDPADHPTILDGENNTPNVVIGTSYAHLDGFTVMGGYVNYGAGMYNSNVTGLIVANCKFSSNSGRGGGGMFNDHSSLEITNCTFDDNSAIWDGSGGGITNSYSSPTITNCIFSHNSAEFVGGGIYNFFSSPTITNCTFDDNSADGSFSYGGGIFNRDSSPTITNCTFDGNYSANYGGGISNILRSSPTITNCIFVWNQADHGGGISNMDESSPTITNCIFSDNYASDYGGGIHNFYSSLPTITNCIMWGDTSPTGPEIALYSSSSPSTLTISYSDVQGGQAAVYIDPGCTLIWGAGNIGELPGDDPLFVTGPKGDYYLSQPPDQGSTSPCVDAGSDTAENLGLDDKTTSTNGDTDTGTVDMGYHYEP